MSAHRYARQKTRFKPKVHVYVLFEGFFHRSFRSCSCSCDAFLVCDDGGTEYVNDCPDGLWYNADTGECDYPDNVDCDVEGAGGGGEKAKLWEYKFGENQIVQAASTTVKA